LNCNFQYLTGHVQSTFSELEVIEDKPGAFPGFRTEVPSLGYLYP